MKNKRSEDGQQQAEGESKTVIATGPAYPTAAAAEAAEATANEVASRRQLQLQLHSIYTYKLMQLTLWETGSARLIKKATEWAM